MYRCGVKALADLEIGISSFKKCQHLAGNPEAVEFAGDNDYNFSLDLKMSTK